ncbi:uncharacterized protein KY384_009121 [Bacidia gigantensis]|uniref:uncharacterized protein n=1 Tax=Bacidia gigantensis TaxID=2732470 RepID=UPI001D047439|nr:uncharacterized protein KY384_009121 [Bacidia gigantensis]KAG8525477.1 hypothetical protein KY384_009121 [Bacidia gigantensis]
MSTADVLPSQREEIKRKKLLKTLLGVTYSYLQLTEGYGDATDADKQERELKAFLSNNDITQGGHLPSKVTEEQLVTSEDSVAPTTSANRASEAKKQLDDAVQNDSRQDKEQGIANSGFPDSVEQKTASKIPSQLEETTLEKGPNLTPPDSGRGIYAEEGSSGQKLVNKESEPIRNELHGFIQGTYDESNSIMDISPLGGDLSTKQQQTAVEQINSIGTPQPAPGMRKQIFNGMHVDTSGDPTFSRRPPMRIDTGMPSATKETSITSEKGPITASETATPSKTAPSSSNAQSPPERMTTRVSSGALRHKSVSEILGETPKTAASPSDRYAQETNKNEQSTPQSAASPDVAAFRLRLSEMKEKERSKLSTVIFAKQQSSTGSRPPESCQNQPTDSEEKPLEERDYFLTFFAAQVYQSPRAPPLTSLLRQAHKTLTTSDHLIEFREKQDYRILNHIKDMQHFNRWSLRQPARSVEPLRPATHWDILLSHMKWMRTDFREERKFKLAGAKFLAHACAAWVATASIDRLSLQVKVRHPPRKLSFEATSATPELVNDENSEMTEDELSTMDFTTEKPPATIFSLPPDVFVFGLNRSPMAEKLLLELPCYDPAKDVQDAALKVTKLDPDAMWKTPLVAVSKYAHGKLVPNHEGPPVKKLRLDYSDLTPSSEELGQASFDSVLRPVEENVALFNPENRHVRDRIHAGHAFKPPTEYLMPSKEFFESRSPSQWTLAEDDELRKLVREYSYNWSLISDCLSSASVYSSGAERRTPWECFERWISLEGLPAEMSKVPYFRTYHQRLQQAARTYEARQQALIQQNGGNPAQLPLRRRSNQPYNVEKRKNNKPLHLIDAMRKHAKKKEAAAHKQQQQGE